jgi:hypothetical protein
VSNSKIRNLAAAGELARLLKRTDRPSTTSGASAVVSLLARR